MEERDCLKQGPRNENEIASMCPHSPNTNTIYL